MYERIKNLRQDRDIKQKDLAKILNVAQTTYSDYELGKINIPISTLVSIAIFYNTSVDYLVGLTDEKVAYPKRKRH